MVVSLSRDTYNCPLPMITMVVTNGSTWGSLFETSHPYPAD